jgi:hypothetical protein
MRRLVGLSLEAFQPFTLASADLGGPIRLADWDGSTVSLTAVDRPGLVRTSSGRDQAEAERVRGAALDGLVAGSGRPRIDQLRAYHRSHWPERGPFSVCMHREEAETHSVTEIRVTARAATIRYLDGPPCHDPIRIERAIPVGR